MYVQARERVADEARHEKRRVQEVVRQEKDERDRHRAEVLAINRLLAQRDEGEFGAYMAARQSEVEEVEARHAAEVLQQAQARKAALREVERQAGLRLRTEHEKERERQARERELLREREERRDAQREVQLGREHERGVQRAQVYAVNRLMRLREDQAFGDFCEARGGLPPPPPPPPPPPSKPSLPSKPPPTDTVVLVPAGASASAPFQQVATIVALSPSKPRRKRATSTSMPAAAIAAAAAAVSGSALTSTHVDAGRKKQEYIASALELRRSHAAQKGEEREVWRAQIYALNRLMREREEASFSYFKELRDVLDAGGDASELPAPPSTGMPEGVLQIQQAILEKREEFRGQSRAPAPPPPPPPRSPMKAALPKQGAAVPPRLPEGLAATASPAGPPSAPLALPLAASLPPRTPPPVVSPARVVAPKPDTPLRTRDKG